MCRFPFALDTFVKTLWGVIYYSNSNAHFSFSFFTSSVSFFVCYNSLIFRSSFFLSSTLKILSHCMPNVWVWGNRKSRIDNDKKGKEQQKKTGVKNLFLCENERMWKKKEEGGRNLKRKIYRKKHRLYLIDLLRADACAQPQTQELWVCMRKMEINDMKSYFDSNAHMCDCQFIAWSVSFVRIRTNRKKLSSRLTHVFFSSLFGDLKKNIFSVGIGIWCRKE